MLLGFHVEGFTLLRDMTVGISGADLLRENSPDAGARRVWPLQPLAAFIGQNNSGKSAIFQAMAFLADCVRHGVVEASLRSGRQGYAALSSEAGEGRMRFEVILSASDQQCLYAYGLELQPDERGKPRIQEETLHRLEAPQAWQREDWLAPTGYRTDQMTFQAQPVFQRQGVNWSGCEGCLPFQTESVEADSPLSALGDQDLPLLALLGRLHLNASIRRVYRTLTNWYYLSFDPAQHAFGYHSSQAYQAQKQALSMGRGGHRHLNADASNLTNVLHYLKSQDRRRYQAFLEKIKTEIPLNAQLYQDLAQVRWDRADVRLFALYLLLEEQPPRPLLLLDGPETGLYPQRLDPLLAALRRYSLNPGCQVLMATHQASLLEGLHPAEVWQFKARTLVAPQPLQPADAVAVSDFADATDDRADFSDPFEAQQAPLRAATCACTGADRLVQALYEEGVGMSSLWYSGYFEEGLDPSSYRSPQGEEGL